MLKYIVPKGPVFNPYTGRPVPKVGDYIEYDQYWIRRKREGLISVTNNRPAPEKVVEPSQELPSKKGKNK